MARWGKIGLADGTHLSHAKEPETVGALGRCAMLTGINNSRRADPRRPALNSTPGALIEAPSVPTLDSALKPVFEPLGEPFGPPVLVHLARALTNTTLHPANCANPPLPDVQANYPGVRSPIPSPDPGLGVPMPQLKTWHLERFITIPSQQLVPDGNSEPSRRQKCHVI
ncbi:hypothetical protein N7463_001692 [Penicillium fimorum]|uniref:Uncharacterized protein n=1 Tax=Penicillium fimorum TaxID=1882269 RepID=A0A9W9XYI0_9EURO|nr:hypothetical protein N7463_001692 [Penicillium fimorum]